MPPSEFYDLTLDEFALIHSGYVDRVKRDQRQQWEIGRMIAFHSLMPHVKKSGGLKPTDIVEFEWEKAERLEQIKEAKKQDYKTVFPKTLKP